MSDDFITKLASGIASGKNRCLPDLVSEGSKALGEYGEANTKLFLT